MPLTQNPIVDWPPALNHLLQGTPIALGSRHCCRIDVDVDRDTLLHLNEFEGHVRHRKVQLRPAGSAKPVVGEMNPLVGLGAAFDPARHIGKVRISFHDLQDEDHADET
jgi:hypothetical protein